MVRKLSVFLINLILLSIISLFFAKSSFAASCTIDSFSPTTFAEGDSKIDSITISTEGFSHDLYHYYAIVLTGDAVPYTYGAPPTPPTPAYITATVDSNNKLVPNSFDLKNHGYTWDYFVGDRSFNIEVHEGGILGFDRNIICSKNNIHVAKTPTPENGRCTLKILNSDAELNPSKPIRFSADFLNNDSTTTHHAYMKVKNDSGPPAGWERCDLL